MTSRIEHIAARRDLDRLVASGADLFVVFTAPGGGGSEPFVSALAAAVDGRPSARVARAVLPEAAEVAALFGIGEAPALVVFRAGVGLFAGPVPTPGHALDGLLQRILALDMDQVRRDIDLERQGMHGTAGVRPCPTRGREASGQ
jgi:thioredoxin 1